MKPIINVIHGSTHCGHDHKTIRSATHCRRLKIRECHGTDVDRITLQAFQFDHRGRYVKVDGNMVGA